MNTYLSKKSLNFTKIRVITRACFTKTALIILFISLTAGLMIRKESVSVTVISALRSCGSGLIPTLFPFIVISDIASKLLRDGKSPLALSFFTGNICGFPLGAKMLSDTYAVGGLTSSAYCRFLPLCSNPGLIFTVAFTGMTLWENYVSGCVLYIITLISGCLTFLIFEIIKPRSIAPATQISITYDSKASSMRAELSAGEIFTSAINNGTISMLKICGFVIFFSVLRVLISDALTYLGFTDIISAFICSLLEISGGEIFLAENALGHPWLYLALTFFVHGFGGLCILSQINSVIFKESGIMRHYLIFKLLQGAIGFVLSLPYCCILF